MKTYKLHIPLTLTAGTLIVLMALVAVTGLWGVFQLYARFIQTTATNSALQYGTALSARLARDRFLQTPQEGGSEAERFRELAETLHRLDPRLEYITIQAEDLIVFHWQASNIDEDDSAELTAVEVSPRVLQQYEHATHVLDFTRELPDSALRLRLGLNRTILDHGQQATLMNSLAVMLRMALITVLAAFSACLLTIIILIWRETRWNSQRRQEEHLTFAGAVAGAVIHDFRNPMSALRLDAQLLEHETGPAGTGRPEKIKELTERITATLERMNEILKELLELSSPDRPAPETFDVNAAIMDCAHLMRIRFEKANVLLNIMTTTGNAKEQLLTLGYPIQFKRALLNVLNNALQFAPKHSQVDLRAQRHGRSIYVTVSDQGPGIPLHEQRKVFQMFYSRRPGGTGMGLALAHAALLNCKGDIVIEATPEKQGCTIRMRLPYETKQGVAVGRT